MGTVFEELIRKFAEDSNETAGEHFTPREVIRLLVNLLFVEDDAVLNTPGTVRTIYDPTAGTGGMLSVADDYLKDNKIDARLSMYGQELNPESYAMRSEEHTSELQSLMRISYAVFCLKKKNNQYTYKSCRQQSKSHLAHQTNR